VDERKAGLHDPNQYGRIDVHFIASKSGTGLMASRYMGRPNRHAAKSLNRFKDAITSTSSPVPRVVTRDKPAGRRE
jgi:hypothetical protein